MSQTNKTLITELFQLIGQRRDSIKADLEEELNLLKQDCEIALDLMTNDRKIADGGLLGHRPARVNYLCAQLSELRDIRDHLIKMIEGRS